MATFTSNYAWTKPAGSDPVDISVLNDNLDSQDNVIHDAFLNMADPFSESSTYAVGDIVVYGTKTYKCHTAVTTAGSWTGAANWDEHKISALVLDNAPTDGSNNPVKSDGIYDSEKDIYAVMGQMGAKNLNVYPYKDTTKTSNNVTFTDNGDGTITVSTTNAGASGNVTFTCHTRTPEDINDLIIKNGKYILTGCPSGGSDSKYRITTGCIKNGGFQSLGIDYGEGVVVTADGDDYSPNGVNIQITIDIRNGCVLTTPIIFNPMLRLASDTDDTYQPYAKTNKQLTDDVSSILTEQDSIETELDTKADKTATASGETLALVPTSEGRALLHTAYGMSTQSGTPTPSSPVEIKSAACDWRINNKNLILFPNYRYRYDSGFLRNGITFTYGEDGVITFSGTSTARTNMSLMAVGENTLIPIKDGVTYTVWCHRMGTQSNQVYFTDYQFDENLNLVSNSNHTDANTYYVTGSSSCRYFGLNVGIYNTDVTITDARVEIMVIEGRYTSTDIPMVSDNYIPPRTTLINTDLTLRAIEVTSSDAYNLVRDGKYYVADTLDYSEDNGFVVTRRIGALTFDGSDDTNFTIASNYVSSDKRLIYNNAIIPSYQNLGYSNAWHKGSINSNFLPECIASANQPYNSVETIGLHLSNHNIQLYIAGKSSVADYMAAFVSNPLNVIYRLATPTTETITTEQALALLGLKTYDESTTITSQAEPSCTVAIEYAKERLGALALTAYNTAKVNDIRITALES